MRATQNGLVFRPWSDPERSRRQAIEETAYFRWLKRNQPFGSPWMDWFAAEAEVDHGRRVPDNLDSFVDERQQALEEAAYFRWVNRGRQTGDPDSDWFAAEEEANRH